VTCHPMRIETALVTETPPLRLGAVTAQSRQRSAIDMLSGLGSRSHNWVILATREIGGVTMLKRFNSRLRDKAVITAAILSVFGHDVAAADQLSFGNDQNDKNTASPIKHVIVIIGENRTFDHIFATYQPKSARP
jgi:hypothetical protein